MAKDEILNAAEMDAAEAEAEQIDSVGVYTHEFKKPFTCEGNTYESLTFNFDSLSGADSLAIENEMMALGKPLVAPEFSGEYLIRMAAKAAKISSTVIEAMPLADYNRIRSHARTFLLKSGS